MPSRRRPPAVMRDAITGQYQGPGRSTNSDVVSKLESPAHTRTLARFGFPVFGSLATRSGLTSTNRPYDPEFARILRNSRRASRRQARVNLDERAGLDHSLEKVLRARIDVDCASQGHGLEASLLAHGDNPDRAQHFRWLPCLHGRIPDVERSGSVIVARRGSLIAFRTYRIL